MNTIMLDEPSHRSTINIIDLDEENSDDVIEVSELKQKGRYDDIMLKNQLLGEFIDKCLELENTEGMHRALSKSLIPLFEKCSKKFQESENLRAIISRAICNLEVSPHFKFSHVAELCQSIKINRISNHKNRILRTAPKRTRKKKITRRMIREMMKGEQNLCKKPEKITEIVLSDDSDGFEVPIVNLDEPIDNVITITENDADRSIQLDDEMEIVSNNQRVADKTNNNRENIANYTIGNRDFTVTENVPICFTQRDDGKENTSVNRIACPETNIASKNGSNNIMEEEINIVDLSDDESVNGQLNSSNAQRNDIHKPLLVPHKVQDEEPIEVRIQGIEKQIGILKTLVVELEEQEVLEDSVISPYILGESYKVRIVELYSLLCSLVNAEPVKRRKVRFTAADERLRLPMKNLEEFINANIGSDGLPHFPDFNDVVECVNAANIRGNMGLTRQKVLEDARTLFTYCGRALQRNRQRREWRHLLGLVKSEQLQDPADSDPALLARLQANRRHALASETELIDRYSEMAPPHLAESEAVNDTDKEDIADVEQVDVLSTPAPKKRQRIAPISCDKFGIVINNHLDPLPRDGFKIVNTLDHKSDDSGQNKNKTNFEVDKTVDDTEVDTPENQLSTIYHTSDVDQNETIASHEDTVIETVNFSACSIPLLHLSATGNQLSVQGVIEDVIHKALAVCNTVTNDSTDQCHTVKSDSINEEYCPETSYFSDNNVFTEGGKVIQIYDTEITDDSAPEQKERINEVDIVEEPIYSHNDRLDNNTDRNGNVMAYDSGNTDTSTNLLSHFLKANVVLPKLPIPADTKRFSIVSDDQNSLLVPLKTSRCKNVNLNISKVVLPTLTILPNSKKVGSLSDPPNSSLVSANTPECETETRLVNEEPNTAKKPGLSNSCNSNNNNVDNTNLNTSLVPSDLSNCELDTDLKEPLIKEEPCIDIQPQLEELGDNFTTTILDIQDPFLVVEISSDSSDDEMDSQVRIFNSAYL